MINAHTLADMIAGTEGASAALIAFPHTAASGLASPEATA